MRRLKKGPLTGVPKRPRPADEDRGPQYDDPLGPQPNTEPKKKNDDSR